MPQLQLKTVSEMVADARGQGSPRYPIRLSDLA